MHKPKSRKKKSLQPNNGFLIVASKSGAYYKSAINLANSILDFYPEAKIMLCTEKELFNESDRDLFDVVDLSAPHHIRAKLYALPRSPYDITAYIDADCEVRHEDISKIFDQLGDADIMLTQIRDYAAANIRISDTETMVWHCGVFLYRNTPLVMDMMYDWSIEYFYQLDAEPWPWPQHSDRMRPWDQYTFYRLYTSEKYSDVKLARFPGEDARWNFVHNYKDTEVTFDPVIYHYTISRRFVDENRIHKEPPTIKDFERV